VPEVFSAQVNELSEAAPVAVHKTGACPWKVAGKFRATEIELNVISLVGALANVKWPTAFQCFHQNEARNSGHLDIRQEGG
jgi:hypothetical protein